MRQAEVNTHVLLWNIVCPHLLHGLDGVGLKDSPHCVLDGLLKPHVSGL
jgi:hypothetical protein